MNGVSERMVRTINSKARAMLIAAEVPFRFWAEAVACAVYIHRRTPQQGLGWKSPVQILTGKKPPFEHFRRFGCLGFRYLHKDQRAPGKWADHARPCMMLGYCHDTTKLWRVYDFESKKAVQISDVTFQENGNASSYVKKAAATTEELTYPFPLDLNCLELLDTSEDDPLLGDTIMREASAPVLESLVDPDSGEASAPVTTSRTEFDPGEGPSIHEGTRPLPRTCLNFEHKLIHCTDHPQAPCDEPEAHAALVAPSHDAIHQLLPKKSKTDDRRIYNILAAIDFEAGGGSRSQGFAGVINDLREVLTLGADPITEPRTYREAMKSPQATKWKAAIAEECKSLLLNETFDLTHPIRRLTDNVMTTKWVSKVKVKTDASIRYKARLVVRGFEAIEGADYDETYALVARMATLRFLISLAAHAGWLVEHMDVTSAFLHPKIDRDNLWIALPDGATEAAHTLQQPHVFDESLRLQKALYGLKQSPRLWYQDIHQTLMNLEFRQADGDANLYIKDGALLLLYVDDIMIIQTNSSGVAFKVKESLMETYKMIDLGEITRFLGIDIGKVKSSLIPGRFDYVISQEHYLTQVIQR